MNVNQVIHCWLAEDIIRVEICRDRHDRRSCKICASCVNFHRKQRDWLVNSFDLVRVCDNCFSFDKSLRKHFKA